MDIQGSLVPGAVVQLTYRVLPGNPNIVQGVRAVVVDSPQSAPTQEPLFHDVDVPPENE